MKLTTRARYALRSMVVISRLSGNNRPVTLERVAERTRLPQQYLGQLAIKLRKASLILGISGRHGGYLLARAPEDIKIGEIVEASIGPINIVDCVLEPDICILSDCCECREVYSMVNEKIRHVFYSITLADLAAKNLSSTNASRQNALRTRCGTPPIAVSAPATKGRKKNTG